MAKHTTGCVAVEDGGGGWVGTGVELIFEEMGTSERGHVVIELLE